MPHNTAPSCRDASSSAHSIRTSARDRTDGTPSRKKRLRILVISRTLFFGRAFCARSLSIFRISNCRNNNRATYAIGGFKHRNAPLKHYASAENTFPLMVVLIPVCVPVGTEFPANFTRTASFHLVSVCNITLDSRQLFSKSDRGFGQIKSPYLQGPSRCTYRFVPDTGQRVELQIYRLVSIGRHNGTA